jgi:hypothetical protein
LGSLHGTSSECTEKSRASYCFCPLLSSRNRKDESARMVFSGIILSAPPRSKRERRPLRCFRAFRVFRGPKIQHLLHRAAGSSALPRASRISRILLLHAFGCGSAALSYPRSK